VESIPVFFNNFKIPARLAKVKMSSNPTKISKRNKNKKPKAFLMG
jgi:hypothetical protein